MILYYIIILLYYCIIVLLYYCIINAGLLAEEEVGPDIALTV